MGLTLLFLFLLLQRFSILVFFLLVLIFYLVLHHSSPHEQGHTHATLSLSIRCHCNVLFSRDGPRPAPRHLTTRHHRPC
ncbi:hypothetical protein O3P69_010152 [Scylla paramamosain]|uniref:Secreted peptide n=1 Tax=Scylla paramamosain TaxID=85552 RepID=A0AAW0TSI5_SCYPA